MTAPAASDEELMRRFQAGDEAAFRTLFDRYAARLVGFASRLLRDRDEAEDLAQEVLLRVYRGSAPYDPRRPFKAWVFTTAARLGYNRLRDRRRRPGVSIDTGGAEGGRIELADPAGSAEIPVEKRERAAAVDKALASLPDDQRTAVLLARFEELSYEEISKALGTTLPAVKSLLYRARIALASRLAPL